LRVSSDEVLVTALKPADAGEGWIVRLFGASGESQRVKLDWQNPAPSRMWLSDTGEKPGEPVQGAVTVPAWGIVTVLAK
jgi:alpha-mannosidase